MTGDAPGAVDHRRSADRRDDTHEVRVGRHVIRVSSRHGTDPSARPLVLLMGLGGNLEMWEPLRSLLATRGGMPTLAFDIPGTGGSPLWGLPRPLALISRLATRVLRKLGVEEFDVMGLSWGGLLAQQLAVTSPRRVGRVILASTNFGVGSVPAGPAALRALLRTARYHDPDELAKAMKLFGGVDWEGSAEAVRHDEQRLAMPPSTRGYYYQLLSTLGWSSLGALPLLRQPTLVLTGDADAAVPAVNARIMTRLIPRARLELLPGGGTWSSSSGRTRSRVSWPTSSPQTPELPSERAADVRLSSVSPIRLPLGVDVA